MSNGKSNKYKHAPTHAATSGLDTFALRPARVTKQPVTTGTSLICMKRFEERKERENRIVCCFFVLLRAENKKSETEWHYNAA